MVTHTSMGLLTLQLSVAIKLETVLVRTRGTYLLLKLQCLLIDFPGLIFPHIPFMWTVAFMRSFLASSVHCRMILPCTHHNNHRLCVTKGLLLPPPIFFLATTPRTSTWIANTFHFVVGEESTRPLLFSKISSHNFGWDPSCSFDLDTSSSILGPLKRVGLS